MHARKVTNKIAAKNEVLVQTKVLVQTITSTKLASKFDAGHEDSQLFKFTRGYMAMMEMMASIRTVRTGDWDLHVEALQLFMKYIFTARHVKLRSNDFLGRDGDS